MGLEMDDAQFALQARDASDGSGQSCLVDRAGGEESVEFLCCIDNAPSCASLLDCWKMRLLRRFPTQRARAGDVRPCW